MKAKTSDLQPGEKRYRYGNYRCSDAQCGFKFEQMFKVASPEELPDELECPSCNRAAPRYIGAPLVATINKNNSDFAERERERLTKRSQEHANGKGKEEAIERERAVMREYTGADK